MTHKKILLIFSCIIAGVVFTACGGRLPKPERAESMLTHHFDRYAKKYPQSPFGNSAVDEVDILEIREIRKDKAEITAFVSMSDGALYKVRSIALKKALGWRFENWEMLATAE